MFFWHRRPHPSLDAARMTFASDWCAPISMASRSARWRHAPDCGRRGLGAIRSGGAACSRALAGRTKPFHPPGSGSGREVLRHLEAIVWLPADALARSGQCPPPGPAHSDRLQPDPRRQSPHHRTGLPPRQQRYAAATRWPPPPSLAMRRHARPTAAGQASDRRLARPRWPVPGHVLDSTTEALDRA